MLLLHSRQLLLNQILQPLRGDGGSKRSKRNRKSKKSKANNAQIVNYADSFFNNVLNSLGYSSPNDNLVNTVVNYTDFDDKKLKSPLPEPTVPLETILYEDSTKDISDNIPKFLELQQLDKEH